MIETHRRRQLYRRSVIVTIYLLAFSLAEALIYLAFAQQGVFVDCALLVILILHAASLSSIVEQRMLLALTLVPLARIVSLSIPLGDFPVLSWYIFIGVPLFVAAFIAARTMQIPLADIGLTRKFLPFQILLGFTGLFLGWVEYQIIRPAPLVVPLNQVVIASVILLVFTGFLEELILRGLIQYTLKEALGGISILYIALYSAVLDLGYPSILGLVFGFAVAIIFSTIVNRTGSVVGVSLAHGIINIACYLIFPLLFTPVLGSAVWHQNHPAQIVFESTTQLNSPVTHRRAAILIHEQIALQSCCR